MLLFYETITQPFLGSISFGDLYTHAFHDFDGAGGSVRFVVLIGDDVAFVLIMSKYFSKQRNLWQFWLKENPPGRIW